MDGLAITVSISVTVMTVGRSAIRLMAHVSPAVKWAIQGQDAKSVSFAEGIFVRHSKIPLHVTVFAELIVC